MWTSTNFVESINERDIDLLLLEELVCSHEFRTWFLESVLCNRGEAAFLGALHSVSNELGESDLLIGFRRTNGHEFAVLMENKVDATFQPDQAERYYRRGMQGVLGGQWQSFTTCLIAPQSYIAADAGANEFDHLCAYETIEHWFLSRVEDAERARFKAKMLRYAVDKSRRKLPSVTAPEVTSFWSEYWKALKEAFPTLQLSEPGAKGPSADWPAIRAATLPPRTVIFHKWAQGCVDLQINGAADQREEFERAVTPSLPPDFSIVVTGKSLVLRVAVPALSRWQPFLSQAAKVRLGLAAAARLAEIGPPMLKASGLLSRRKAAS